MLVHVDIICTRAVPFLVPFRLRFIEVLLLALVESVKVRLDENAISEFTVAVAGLGEGNFFFLFFEAKGEMKELEGACLLAPLLLMRLLSLLAGLVFF